MRFDFQLIKSQNRVNHAFKLKQVLFQVPKIECKEKPEDEIEYLDWEEETKTQMTSWMTCKVS